LANIDKFVKEVKQVDYMNLFINALSNEERGRELDFMFPAKPEDLIKKQIAEATRKYQIDAVVGVSADCKVNLICTALKESLEKVNVENKYLLCILTTYIKREP
jgi:hypothetical protein